MLEFENLKRRNGAWTPEQQEFLIKYYPEKGRRWCARVLKTSTDAIRAQTHKLGLYQNSSSEFAQDWQKRAAKSKIGKKRPEQALVIDDLRASGRLSLTDKVRMAISLALKKRIATNGHNKGMLGKKHSSATKLKFSKITQARWDAMTDEQKTEQTKKMIHTRHLKGKYAVHRVTSSWKAAWREFGGKRHFYRSKWEANYGRFLEFLKIQGKIKDWLHEPDVFWFEGIKRGCVSYLPDFKIINNDNSIEYHEVKGWMDDRSITKLKRMAKYFPEIMLNVIREKQYKEILAKLSPLIADWE